MKRVAIAVIALLGLMTTSLAHNPGAYLTWNRDISRVFYARCANCHHQGGTALSLMTYPEVQPHLTEIKEQVLGRRMPPWGAVKGFGNFRNDQGLTQEEIELVGDWIDQNAPKGNNPNLLPPLPKFPSKAAPFVKPSGALAATNESTLERDFTLDGLYPEKTGNVHSMRIVATFPGGHLEPLLWLYEYKDSTAHPFLLRSPILLPKGTVIRGIAPEAVVYLLPKR